jgi:hypothetical protein
VIEDELTAGANQKPTAMAPAHPIGSAKVDGFQDRIFEYDNFAQATFAAAEEDFAMKFRISLAGLGRLKRYP